MEKPIARKLRWPRKWGLRRCVRGMTLSCGCVAGVYETFAGDAVTVIDVPSPSCAVRGHDVNVLVPQGDTPQTAWQ
jgi:hypothetical protein